MRQFVTIALCLLALLVTRANVSHAQSVTVTPVNPSVVTGGKIQFAATVSGLSSSAVVWSVAPKGGSISKSGLYTAPAALPKQNPVQILATSSVTKQITGIGYAYILSHGPKITSVSPDPVTAGTFTVTIQGTGFKSGATVMDQYGSNPLQIQLTTISVKARTIVATGYLGPALSTTFCVKNPGSVCSNSIVVPVTTGQSSATPTATATQTATSTPTATRTGSPEPTKTASSTATATSTVTATKTATASATLTATPTATKSPEPTKTATLTATATATSTPVATSSVSSTATPTATSTPGSGSSIPFPVSSHPRLWITQADLPRLQSWATSSNPIYQQGMASVLNQAVTIYNTQFFPGGAPNPNYPDPGDTQGYTGYLTEQYAAILAFNSLIDPNPTSRIQYAQYARNLLMYAMNLAALGPLSGAPFRDPLFPVYNRANGSGEQWPLIVDWIYNATDASGNPILTASDKLTIRNVFMMWANACLSASTTGGDHPTPIGVINDPTQLLLNNQPYRMASNNYYLGHARLLTMMALSIDPGDDPRVNSSAPASQLGNTLRSYIADATGAWLYQEFAMMGDPATVASSYGLSGNGAGFGLASGGLPPEGMLYGHSFSFVLGQLLALQTAGFNSQSYSGPQIQLIGSPVWDRYVAGYLSSMVPAAEVPATETWLGPVYEFASYGDLLRLYVTPDVMQSYALLALLNHENGKTSYDNAADWFVINAPEGGASGLMTRITDPWSWSSTDSILYFMLLDPTAPVPTDPRPALATTFVDPAAGRVLAHSDWTSNGTMFDYRASWESINHQDGDGGQFEFYRNGEWLTKEMSNYDDNGLGQTTVYHNTLALQNYCVDGTPALQWFETGEWANGSQWILGENAGDPTTVTSFGPGYVYASSDLTNLYNRPDVWSPNDGATNITRATRAIVWLNNDYIVVYDHATSLNSGLFKRFNLSMVTSPAIAANTATETLPSGQQLFVQTLLPQTASASAAYDAGNLSSIAELEPTQYVYTVEDPTLSADTEFLHVLQGANAGVAMTPATLAQSTTGAPFDGAVFGSAGVYFPLIRDESFTATTFPAPAGVHEMLVTGLAPGAAYAVSIKPAGNGNTVSVTPAGSGSIADAAGVLALTF
jgi:hypothetical protein